MAPPRELPINIGRGPNPRPVTSSKASTAASRHDATVIDVAGRSLNP